MKTFRQYLKGSCDPYKPEEPEEPVGVLSFFDWLLEDVDEGMMLDNIVEMTEDEVNKP